MKPYGTFQQRLSRPERIINWIGGEPPLIERTPFEIAERVAREAGLPPAYRPLTMEGTVKQHAHICAILDAQADMRTAVMAMFGLGGPFDWAKECPGDVIRQFPPVVGEGRGHVYRP